MKRLMLTIIVSALFLLGLAYPSLASTFYVEGLVNGKAESPLELAEDAGGFIGGFDIRFNDFLMGFEYLGGELKTSSQELLTDDIEQNIATVKAGYRLLETERTAFDLTLSYYQQQLDGVPESDAFLSSSDKITFDGMLIGVDFNLFLSKRTALELAAAVSLNGNYEVRNIAPKERIDADIFNYKLKLNYLFSDHFGASLGYRAYLSKNADDAEFNTTSLTGGVFYTF